MVTRAGKDVAQGSCLLQMSPDRFESASHALMLHRIYKGTNPLELVLVSRQLRQSLYSRGVADAERDGHQHALSRLSPEVNAAVAMSP